ncbi:hypothetical protein [Armatimonas rosea]|uniref:Uncharacterized protein n=1 Tax=Armatimonas rosea TaxID=685828 RepID=A0A7W9W8W8_ARMRO|nr:hypothetical protein [Armatimonas rosea]MBB6052696.1 hypothetical protein [Armatimonas rosea]
MAVSSDPNIVPAWPFLVANHELGRVDYRTVVAPDFLADQAASQVLTALPMDLDDSGPFLCELSYRSGKRSLCKVTVLYTIRTIPSAEYFPIRPQRAVQIISGLVLPQPLAQPACDPTLLEECFTLYSDDYRQFCWTMLPRDYPIVLSWPLAVSVAPHSPLTVLPPLDTTRIHSRALPSRPAAVIPQQRAERAFPIARTEVLARISQESRLRRLFRRFLLRR